MKLILLIVIRFLFLSVDFIGAECNTSLLLDKNSYYFPRNQKIYDRHIIYEDDNDIRGYDIGFDRRFNTSDDIGFFNVTNNNLLNINPDIYVNNLVWVTFNLSSDIYRCDLNNNSNYGGCLWNDTKVRVTDYLSLKRRPFLFKDLLLWEDNLAGNFDIISCGIDINCVDKKIIANNSFNQINVNSDGNIVVWEDHRNGNSDIYMFDINKNKEYPMVVDVGSQRKPTVIYKYFILWDSNKNLSDDIYFKSIGNDLVPYTFDDSWEYTLAGSLFDEINVEVSKDGKPKIIIWETSKFNNIGLEGYDILNNSFFEVNISGIDFSNPSLYNRTIVFEGLGNQKKYLFISEC